MFEKHGEEIFKRRFSLFGIWRASYSSDNLKKLLSAPEIFGDQTVGACKHPVLIPAINYSSGEPQMFKTPHNVAFKRDHQFRLVDVSLATSAAPAYFPRHTFNNNQYVDGGLYANAPGLLAIHEAQTFLGQLPESIHMLSIGTMSSKFTANSKHNRNGGTYDWGGLNPVNTPKRLFGLAISVQEGLSNKMLEHRLPGRYVHLDDELTDQRAAAVALDKTDAAAREVLLGAASERSKVCIGRADCQAFLTYQAPPAKFYYGQNTN